MYFHWENDQNYDKARAAVALGNAHDDAFIHKGNFRPFSKTGFDDPGDSETNKGGSPRSPVIVNDDCAAYFLSAWNENASLNLYRLSSDYTRIDALVTTLYAGPKREAPCLFKRNGH